MPIDWSKIYKKYKGLWVALKDDHITVVASAKTAKEILNLAAKKGYDNSHIMRVPEKIVSFAG